MAEQVYHGIINISEELEDAGLIWQPEIGDEVSDRRHREMVSILVDPQGLSPNELRSSYIWLPSVEQLVQQVEARQGILQHMGLELSGDQICYRTVLRARAREIEAKAESLRISLGLALRDMIIGRSDIYLQ